MKHKKIYLGYLGLIFGMSLMMVGVTKINTLTQFGREMKIQSETYATELVNTKAMLESTSASLSAVLSDDQFLRNNALEAEIEQIEKTYTQTVLIYEDLVDLKLKTTKTVPLDNQYAQILSLLAERNYATAGAVLKDLAIKIKAEEEKLASAYVIPANVPVSNTPPGSGYQRQQVQIEIGTYMVSVVAADLNNTRVVVDTASDSTCTNDCPVLALSDFVSRSGAFAGINGPYFCPASYPSCAGKTNSFDTLIMNKNKTYFNSDNNVYSLVPAVIFSGSSARFVGQTSEWGRSTDPDSVIAAQPFLVANGNVVFGGDGDPKKGSKGPRGFIGTTGSTVYIGHVHNATVAESARVLQSMGIQNALNLDGGGSVALWSGGYKVGPGRALPLAILLVRK